MPNIEQLKSDLWDGTKYDNLMKLWSELEDLEHAISEARRLHERETKAR